MSKLWNLTRRCAAGFIAAQLLIVPVATGFSAAPASAATVSAEHGAWQGFSSGSLVGVMTRMDSGGIAAFVVKGDSYTLLLSNPNWSLKVGARVPVSVTIDGEVFTGTAVASDTDMIEMPNVTTNVLRQFVDGAKAVVDVNDGEIVWSLDLDGFTASMADALRLYRASL
jgi:hypothetical protein